MHSSSKRLAIAILFICFLDVNCTFSHKSTSSLKILCVYLFSIKKTVVQREGKCFRASPDKMIPTSQDTTLAAQRLLCIVHSVYIFFSRYKTLTICVCYTRAASLYIHTKNRFSVLKSNRQCCCSYFSGVTRISCITCHSLLV